MDARGARPASDFNWVAFQTTEAGSRWRRLHLRHRERAVSGAAGAAGQNPRAGNRIAAGSAGQRERVARWRSGLHIHSEFAAYLAIEVAAQDKRTTRGFARIEAWGIGSETEIHEAQRAITFGSERCAEIEIGRVAVAEQGGVPRPVDIGRVRTVRTASD